MLPKNNPHSVFDNFERTLQKWTKIEIELWLKYLIKVIINSGIRCFIIFTLAGTMANTLTVLMQKGVWICYTLACFLTLLERISVRLTLLLDWPWPAKHHLLSVVPILWRWLIHLLLRVLWIIGAGERVLLSRVWIVLLSFVVCLEVIGVSHVLVMKLGVAWSLDYFWGVKITAWLWCGTWTYLIVMLGGFWHEAFLQFLIPLSNHLVNSSFNLPFLGFLAKYFCNLIVVA